MQKCSKCYLRIYDKSSVLQFDHSCSGSSALRSTKATQKHGRVVNLILRIKTCPCPSNGSYSDHFWLVLRLFTTKTDHPGMHFRRTWRWIVHWIWKYCMTSDTYQRQCSSCKLLQICFNDKIFCRIFSYSANSKVCVSMEKSCTSTRVAVEWRIPHFLLMGDSSWRILYKFKIFHILIKSV